MLGDQAAPDERGRELGPGGGEAEVAHQRHGQAEAGAGTVDRGDDRLRDGESGTVTGRGSEAATDRPVAIPAERLEVLHVGAGAEPPAGAGDDDRAHVVALRRTPSSRSK